MDAPAHPDVSTPESDTVRREGGGRCGMAVIYLAVHLGALGVLWTGISWAEAVTCLVVLQARGFCVSAGYHRLFAHRAFKTSRGVQFLFAAGACSALRGGPLWWTGLHRFHHRYPDGETDIFPPEKGLWWSYVGWLVSGRYDKTDLTRVRDLARLPELRWLNRYWLLPPAALAAGTALVGGWSGFCAVFCLSSALLLHLMAALDALNHSVGSQRYDTGDESRNSFWLSLVGGGEGWHNNHHHYPASARQGFFWWEVDGTYTYLQLLSWVGLVWDLKTPPPTILTRGLLRPPEPAAGEPSA